MVGRGVLRFKKGVCSKRVSGSVVLEASSSRARFICTTVVQIGVAEVPQQQSCTRGTAVLSILVPSGMIQTPKTQFEHSNEHVR